MLFNVKSKEVKEDVVKELIKRRRLQMLVHSCIYYELNDSIINDTQFDTWAKELYELQKVNPTKSKQVEYYEYFKDWDGSSGYDLPIRLPNIYHRATTILKNTKGRN